MFESWSQPRWTQSLPKYLRRMVLLLIFSILIVSSCGTALVLGFFKAPGKGYEGSLPDLSFLELEISQRQRNHLEKLCSEIGQRNYEYPENLEASVKYLSASFEDMGYTPSLQEILVPDSMVSKNLKFYNVIAEKRGTKFPEEIIIVGAHYDSVANHHTVGADDNASAVAVLLELARLLSKSPSDRTIRFVAFANEEPPFFKTPFMGSRVYARECREKGEDIQAMICLEMLGYYSDEEGSQSYPYPLGFFLSKIFGDRGNFLAFIGNISSRPLMLSAIKSFRESTDFPSQGIVLPSFVTGVDWSDHASFWFEGYPAIMVGNTALYRNKWYHTPEDTPDKLDYDRMARVTVGLSKMISVLAGSKVSSH